jgi:hypothetical protein
MMMVEDFKHWYRRARRGSAYTYYRGHLAFDRGPDDWKRKTDEQIEISHLANLALDYESRGLIQLRQRKIGTNSYSYEAIRRG